LAKAGIIKISKEDISSAVDRTYPILKDIKNKAKEIAKKLVNKVPIIICAEHLSGNAQIIRNQFNETSKTFSAYFLVPDLNHHLMEGLQFPKHSNIHFLLFQTKNYSHKIQKRMELTKEIVLKNSHTLEWVTIDGKTVYDDFVYMLLFGSYTALYLGLIYNQNPAINPWVDYFKEELARN
jgi:glucose/mannose-6-phosphate isomerase